MLTAGESHGKALVAVLEGLPADVPVDPDRLAHQLARRRHGHGRGGRQRFESDRFEILTGVRHGRTLGSPIAVTIPNLEFEAKYAIAHGSDRRARGRQAAHAPATWARRPRRRAEVRVRRRPQRAGAGQRARDRRAHDGRHVLPVVPRRTGDRDRLARRAHRVGQGSRPCRRARTPMPPTRSTGRRSAASTRPPHRRWWPRSTARRKERDTVGGVFEVLAYGAPPGLGSYVHYDRKLDGRLALALMSIQSVKGVEIGDGFATRREAGIEGPRRDRGARRARVPRDRACRRHRGRDEHR